MKRKTLACALFLAVAIAMVAAAPGPVTVPRYVSGAMDGRFVFEWVGPGEWDLATAGDVTGTLRHLGLAKMYSRHTPNWDGTLTNGTFTIVAANGDEISGTYEGSGYYVAADQVHGDVTLVITGGTGRFAGATGTIDANFLETFDDPTWWSARVAWKLGGTVNY